MFLAMGYSSSYVNTSEKDKDKGLNDGGEDSHSHEGKRKDEWNNRGNNDNQQFFSKYISEESDGQIERSREMADDFDGEKERGDKRNRPSKMF